MLVSLKLRHALREEQRRSLGWMLAVEKQRVKVKLAKANEKTKAIPTKRKRVFQTFVQLEEERRQQELEEHTEVCIQRFATRGGLLADKMGFGKTCVAISLISATLMDFAEPTFKDAKTAGYIPTNATLIMAPSHLVEQWTGELQKFLCTDVDITWAPRKKGDAIVHAGGSRNSMKAGASEEPGCCES